MWVISVLGRMAGKKVKIYSFDIEDGGKDWVGTVDVNDGDSYAALRVVLDDPPALDWPYDFWDVEEGCRIRQKLERLNKLPSEVLIVRQAEGVEEGAKRRRVEDANFNIDWNSGTDNGDVGGQASTEPLSTADTNPAASSRVSVSAGIEGDDTGSEPMLQSVLISKEVLGWYQSGEEKLRKDLANVSLEDHIWHLKTWDQHKVAVVKLHCAECVVDFGGDTGEHSKDSVRNLFSNFKKSHIMSSKHIRNWCRRKGLDFANHPQSTAKKGKPVVLTVSDHKRLVQEGLEILQGVNNNIGGGRPTFEVVGDTESDNVRCFFVKVKCTFCSGSFLQLCPPKKNLEANLVNHVQGSNHATAVEKCRSEGSQRSALNSGKRGRPSRSFGNSGNSNESQMHKFFRHSQENGEPGEFLSSNRAALFSFMCWGLTGPKCSYGGKVCDVSALLQDPHPGNNWFVEPHVKADVKVHDNIVQVSGVFRHKECLRFALGDDPFLDLTCPKCARIPHEPDFRGRVLREEQAVEKRGCRGTEGGRRIGYLSMAELAAHGRNLSKKYRYERMSHWACKARIVQLKVKRPTFKEAAKGSQEQGNIVKFCNNILLAHRTGAFGGRPALWDYLKDVAKNLNRSKRGFRFSDNTKALSQAMKVYGGRRMCDLFQLNYDGPSYSTTKRECKKGVQFIAGEHSEIFASVAQIYRDAKAKHMIVGPVPILLAEDETKVKGRIAYEAKWDTLSGFCGSKVDHVCVSKYKPVVGSRDNGYNKIVDSFRSDKIGGFARVVMVNPLHQSLPRLVLVVNCTCNCFDASLVKNQWRVIDDL